MMRIHLKSGDRVRYTEKFLQSLGEISGPMPAGRGVIKSFTALGPRNILVTIDWGHNADVLPGRVNIKNIESCGGAT